MRRPNRFGLFDMLGNVDELVNDWFDPNYYRSSASQDPPGPLRGTGQVARGGSWYDDPKAIRLSYRSENVQNLREDIFGFRCVCEAVNP